MNVRQAKIALPIAMIAFVAVFPLIISSNYWLNLINLAISFSIACLGLNIVLGYSGQMNLAQASFWGVGAYTSALLVTKLGAPVWFGMIAAPVVTALFGILLGVPALKMSGHYLAVATIGFGIILQLILINQIDLTNGSDGITQIPSPYIGPIALADAGTFFYLAAFALILVTWACIRMKGSRYGRALLAIKQNEMAAETTGIDTTHFKVAAFALCAAYGGFGGALFAHSGSHYISPDTFSFDQSVNLLAMAMLGGTGSAVGSIIGATLLSMVPEVLRFLKDSYMMFYAAGIVLIMIFMPGGIAALLYQTKSCTRIREWWGKDSETALAIAAAGKGTGPTAKPVMGGSDATAAGEPVLTIKGLAKHFGGLKAVDGVDMQIRKGEIQALIGPNGSGKTTILNMISGLYVPTFGEMDFSGIHIAGKRPHYITAVGMARTFQNIRLFGELSVLDNVLIGQHCRSKAGLLRSVFQPASQKAEEAAMRTRALEMLAFVGLRGKELAKAASLPYGQQRLLEIARALVSDPKLLLLDEPAAGLNAAETDQMIELLYQIREQGITILLVEHDMSLVMRVSDHITVLNFGKKIAEGTAEQIETNQEVIDAYLGTEVGNA